MHELLRLDDGLHCGAAQTLARGKLDGVEKQIANLKRMQSRLKRTLAACARGGGRARCPLIEALLA